MRDDQSAGGSTVSGSTNSLTRGANQPPPRRKRRSSKMKRLAESVGASSSASGSHSSGATGAAATLAGSASDDNLRYGAGSSSAAVAAGGKKGILRGDHRGSKRRSSGDAAAEEGGDGNNSVASEDRSRRHSVDFANMIAAGYHDDDTLGGITSMSVRTEDTSSTHLLPGHWPRQGETAGDLEDIELATKGEDDSNNNNDDNNRDSIRSRGSRSTMSGFGLGTGSKYDKAAAAGFSSTTTVPTQFGLGGDDLVLHGDNNNNFSRSDSDSEGGDERSVATLSSVNTLLNMMQMALDEDWWKDRAQAWEQSRAEPVKPALQTEEDKKAMRKRNHRTWCGWYTNMPKRYRMLWVTLVLLTLIATVVLTTTDWGEKVIQDMAQSMSKLKNGSVEGKVDAAYADEGEN
mmetsp:Transcript_21251/g.44531  ORF Transcript_21251/g.44531 Transcript_21251/m.44531 type:complete len:403 (+) Transcript_21251:279-1487(+)